MLGGLKASISFILSHAGWVEFLAYGFVFTAFLLCLLLAFYIAFKSWWQIGFLIIVLGLGGLFWGLYEAHGILAKRLHPASVELVSSKRLEYSPAVLVELKLTNKSSKDYKICQIIVDFYRQSEPGWRDELSALRPFHTAIFQEQDLLAGQSVALVKAVRGVAGGDFGLRVKMECY